MPYVEKCCSRCHQVSWDSSTGSYQKVCSKDNKRCDTNGNEFSYPDND